MGSEDEEEEGGLGLEGGARSAFDDFLADAGSGFGSEDEESEEEEQPRKKAKWFQQDGKRKPEVEEREIETFDDLEAEAAKLLG